MCLTFGASVRVALHEDTRSQNAPQVKQHNGVTVVSRTICILIEVITFSRPASLTATTSETSFIKKLKSSGRSLVVFYGSQTGTGEEFAGRLAKEGIRYKLKGMVADPEECDMVRSSFYTTINDYIWISIRIVKICYIAQRGSRCVKSLGHQGFVDL